MTARAPDALDHDFSVEETDPTQRALMEWFRDRGIGPSQALCHMAALFVAVLFKMSGHNADGAKQGLMALSVDMMGNIQELGDRHARRQQQNSPVPDSQSHGMAGTQKT